MGKVRGASDDDLPRTGGRVAHALCRAVRRVVGFRRGVPGAGGGLPDRARQTTSWEPPNRRTAEPPNRRTAEPPNRRTAELSSRLRYTVESRAWPSGSVHP
ncbi:hypothetical protein FE789_05360 [Burkholderia pseudomallei]|nr:hypothetical protein FE789_05360 [Burkholderia pseudomallei]